MDDITFCLSDCQRTDCFRHPSNIQDRTIPHSYAYFRETDTCPSRQLIEKMQLSKEDATKDTTFPVDGEPIDCISRQHAILSIERNAYRREDINETEHIIKWVLDIIKWLPSVQTDKDRMIQEIRERINSPNRGTADYFIVDQVEEIISKYE